MSALDERFLIQVSENIHSLQECYNFVSQPSCGAVGSFVGVTRDNFEGKVVVKLSYDGYVPMATNEIRKICDEGVLKYPTVARIAVAHILGSCPVGEPSVIICASSPHRKDALDCVSFLIYELKARVPIWKKEIYEGDLYSWKENSEGKYRRVNTNTHES